MKYAVYLPNYGDDASAQVFAELASEAEVAGWDGFFLWDHMLVSKDQKLNIIDPWIALAAVAVKTSRIRFGTTVTPVPRRRPWHLARETASLDQLSDGRLILSVGIGEPADAEYAAFGEDPDPRIRGEKLDEGLDILSGLWSGKPFGYQGRHYRVEKVTFRPPTIQRPRIPVWVGGFWPNKPPFRRAARWDGVLPLKKTGGFAMGPEDIKEMMVFIRAHRTQKTPYDVAIIGTRSGLGKKPAVAARALHELEQAGATWWLQGLYGVRNSAESLRAVIRQGPPA
jgi:alkanesulfonate monooxygenase SsuD/methylene tetrahydromethanopterin reductase-like flavin-dependent oxidoreductase (luciferase family)